MCRLSYRLSTGECSESGAVVPALCVSRNVATFNQMNGLDLVDFGVGAAQQEQQLANYFFRSGAFRQACSAKTYLVLGAKGAGKSAIFRMLQELQSEIPLLKPPNLWLADEPRLREHSATLKSYGISSAVTLWRFYVCTSIINACLDDLRLPDDLRKSYQRFLVRWGLVREVPTVWQAMKRIKWSVGFGDYAKLEAPSQVGLSVTEIEYVILTTDEWLDTIGVELWLGLDSLDEVSTNGASSDDTEDLSSSLMRAVGELIRLKRIRLKLFFRTDLYRGLTYVNKDHFSTSKLELQWPKEDLAIMLGYRLRVLHPEHSGHPTYAEARAWVDEFFNWPTTGILQSFDELYQLMRDGNDDVLPRDLINFCIGAQKLQDGFNIQGIEKPAPTKLVSPEAIRQAFLQTAASKLSDFLQVYNNFSETYDQLRGSPSRQFNRTELGEAIGKKDPLDAGLVIADLVRVGALAILDDRSVNRSDSFEIPMLYAVALKIGDSHARI